MMMIFADDLRCICPFTFKVIMDITEFKCTYLFCILPLYSLFHFASLPASFERTEYLLVFHFILSNRVLVILLFLLFQWFLQSLQSAFLILSNLASNNIIPLYIQFKKLTTVYFEFPLQCFELVLSYILLIHIL